MAAYCVAYYTVFLWGSRMKDQFSKTFPDLPRNELKTAFLDKLCIHQTEPIQKQKGINAIGAFLIRSDRVTILWDATYFTRLWCVFEVAIFGRLNPGCKIEFFPITLGKLESFLHLAVCLVCTAISLHLTLFPDFPMFFRMARGGYHAKTLQDGAGGLSHILDWALGILVSDAASCWLPLFIFHQWRRHVHYLLEVPKILANFSAQKANCFSETDRQFVESVIVVLYDTIEKFDETVRGPLASRLNSVVGTESVPSLPLPLIYRSMCVPLFVCVGMDHGFMWNSTSLMSLLLTLGLTFPGLCCMFSKFLSFLPPLDTRLDFWFMFFVFVSFWGDFVSFRFGITWMVVLFEGMRWGLLSRQRGFGDLVVQCPVDFSTLLFFGGFLLAEKFWSNVPRSDKRLSRK